MAALAFGAAALLATERAILTGGVAVACAGAAASAASAWRHGSNAR